MQNHTSGQPQPTPANAYRPSVPISVYRELTAELQAAQAMLDSLNAQNQQLAKQNQQLRQELHKVVQSTMHVQQVISAFEPTSTNEMPSVFSAAVEPIPTTPVRRQRPVVVPPRDFSPSSPYLEPTGAVFSEKLLREVEVERHRRPTQSAAASEVSGWWLAVAIFLIVLTAFGTGFLIVRPLLKR